MNILDCHSKIDVLLVQPDHGEEVKRRIFQPGIELPFSLACLSAYLEKQGISNEIFDWRIYEHPDSLLKELLANLKPFLVGITAVTSAIENAKEVAKLVKESNKRILTVIGGCHASALPEETLSLYPYFDYLVHGEGEASFTNLIRSVKNGNNPKDLKGIAYRQNGEVRINQREELIANLDELPFPARHKLELDKYAPSPATRNYLRLPSTGLYAGRGCPYNCQFCYKGVWGKSVRFRSSENIIAEIEECIDKYGIHDFRFYDDVLTFPRWDLKSFCNKVIEKGLDISWNCWSRVDNVTYETLSLMKKAGCYHIKYGIEFGTEKALELSKKGASLKQAKRAIELTKRAGIECKGSFLFGIPGETIEDCRKTLKFALELSPDFATFYAYDCIPGSPFFEKLKANPSLKKNGMLPHKITEKMAIQAYRIFYLRPAFILLRINNILRNPGREIQTIFNGIRMMARFFYRKNQRFFYNKR